MGHELSISVERDDQFFLESSVEPGKVLDGPFSTEEEATAASKRRSLMFELPPPPEKPTPPMAFDTNHSIVRSVRKQENPGGIVDLPGDCDANKENCKSFGLMQLKLLKPGEIYMDGIPAVSLEDLLDSAKSIKLATQLLNRYHEKFNGDLDKILAAYNQGYTATRDAIRDADAAGKDWLSLLQERVQLKSSKNDPKNYIIKVKAFMALTRPGPRLEAEYQESRNPGSSIRFAVPGQSPDERLHAVQEVLPPELLPPQPPPKKPTSPKKPIGGS